MEDCASPAWQYPFSPTTRSSSDTRSLYVTKPRHRSQAGREDHSTTDGGGSLKPTLVDSPRQGLHANRENGGSHPGIRDTDHHRQNRSPLRHHYQGRLGNKLKGASSSCERSSVEGGTSSPSTPGRSKLRAANARAHETPDRTAPLPKFGEWDEKDPTSADDFTHIFNKKREEKLTGIVTIPAIGTTLPVTPTKIKNHKQASVSQSKSLVWCCIAPRTFE